MTKSINQNVCDVIEAARAVDADPVDAVYDYFDLLENKISWDQATRIVKTYDKEKKREGK